jgi:hypothetical protein
LSGEFGAVRNRATARLLEVRGGDDDVTVAWRRDGRRCLVQAADGARLNPADAIELPIPQFLEQ